MKELLGCILLVASITVFGQGIEFERELSWRQTLNKAKQEGKFIFVDFYATWCGPCKAMDTNVYPSTKLGAFANKKFISIKIQQNKSPLDDTIIKSWYYDADSLSRLFNIVAFPSLLFFSPDGLLISKCTGYKDEATLLTLFDSAVTTKNGFQMKVEEYRRRKLSYTEIASLALKAQEMGNMKLADSMALDYKNGYLYKLNDSLLITRKNLQFIAQFPLIINSQERVFKFFLKEQDRMDELVRSGYSQDIVKFVIASEIDRMLFSNGKPITKKPDWKKIRKYVEDNYGKRYVDLFASLSAKIAFYKKEGNWKAYAKLINAAIRKYPPKVNGYVFANKTMIGNFFQRDDWNLNSGAWDIFLHCDSKSILKVALQWSDLSLEVVGSDNGVRPIDQLYDTKGNLLYKLGRIQEAIEVEEKAYEIAKSNAEKNGRNGGGKGFLATIEKMRKGTPTWNEDN